MTGKLLSWEVVCRHLLFMEITPQTAGVFQLCTYIILVKMHNKCTQKCLRVEISVPGINSRNKVIGRVRAWSRGRSGTHRPASAWGVKSWKSTGVSSRKRKTNRQPDLGRKKKQASF